MADRERAKRRREMRSAGCVGLCADAVERGGAGAKPTPDSLTEAAFWALIAQLDWAQTGDDNTVIAPVVNALSKSSFRHILDFADILSHKLYLLDGEVYLQQNEETTP